MVIGGRIIKIKLRAVLVGTTTGVFEVVRVLTHR
jgi:hypothetical protein